jgi:ADP-dependent phosphofructokinase/glucokinase
MYISKRTLKLILLQNIYKITTTLRYLKLKSRRPALSDRQKEIIKRAFELEKPDGQYEISIEEFDWVKNNRAFCRCPDQGLMEIRIIGEYYPGYKVELNRWIVCRSCLANTLASRETNEED